MASNRVSTYSADELTISLAGLLLGDGIADGDFITIETAAEDFVATVGSDGEVARAKTNNRMATVKIKLLQTSLANNRLSTLRQTDIDTPNGAGIGEFQIRDRSSGVLCCKAPKAWIEKPPSLVRGREIATNEWTIRLAFATIDFSGNPTI
jgi:hypothetical protein